MHITNDSCKLLFGILIDELKTHKNIRLTCASNMALCKKIVTLLQDFKK